jgi:hypothetical protein
VTASAKLLGPPSPEGFAHGSADRGDWLATSYRKHLKNQTGTGGEKK